VRRATSTASATAWKRRRETRIGSPAPAVQGRQLGVLPEAAGKQIDLAELTDELAASTRKRCRIGDAKDGAGPERAQPRGGDHEPPETTTGGDCVDDGAGPGVGAGGDAAPSFPGPGAAGSGGIAVLERADAAIC